MSSKNNRGLFLNAIFILCALSLLINLIGLVHPFTPRDLYLHSNVGLYAVWLVITLINATALINAFLWRKWGAMVLIIMPIFNLAFSMFFLSKFVPINVDIELIIFLIILTWAVVRKWEYFR